MSWDGLAQTFQTTASVPGPTRMALDGGSGALSRVRFCSSAAASMPNANPTQ